MKKKDTNRSRTFLFSLITLFLFLIIVPLVGEMIIRMVNRLPRIENKTLAFVKTRYAFGMKPNQYIADYYGASVAINKAGQRDRDYPVPPPPATGEQRMLFIVP